MECHLRQTINDYELSHHRTERTCESSLPTSRPHDRNIRRRTTRVIQPGVLLEGI